MADTASVSSGSTSSGSRSPATGSSRRITMRPPRSTSTPTDVNRSNCTPTM